MSGIFDFLQSIVDFFKLLFDFVIQLVTGLFQLLMIIPSAVSTLSESINFLPAFLVGFAGVTITVSVIFIIVGRESGGEK